MSHDGEHQPAIILSSTSPAAATTTLATASTDAANINIPPPTTDPATLSKKRGAEELSLAEEPRSGIPPLGDATNGATILPHRTQLIDLAVRSGSPVIKQSAVMPLYTGNGGEQEGGMHVDVDGEGPSDAAISPSKSSPQESAAAATATAASTTTTSTTPETQAHPPKKKQKLSPTSKEAKEKERKLREQQKAEEKARRDEERRKREEERKQREEAREQKRRAKEEERLARDEEKKRREKSQMRLNAFFAKPKVSAQGHREHSSPLKSEVASTTKAEESKPATDYELEFRPFFLQSHTTILPIHRFQRDEITTKQALDILDSALSKQSSSSASSSLSPPDNSISKPACRILSMKPQSRQLHNARKHSVKEILHMLYHPTSWRTDLANTTLQEPSINPEYLIKQIPMKTLQFAEDVRPPYQGTFTRPISPRDAASLARNPFKRAIPGINYDYDSEAEWDDPEEGEDLDSDDGDEEQLDEEDEDMDGFLDDGEDEGVSGARKKVVVGDLEPVSSGLVFEGEDGGKGDSSGLAQFALEVIGDNIKLPIDPFSTAYWDTPAEVKQAQADNKDVRKDTASEPLNPTRSTLTGPVFNVSTAISKTKRTFPADQLAEFKQVIQGSNLTKAGLTEVLKKRFPKVSKDVIRDTLTAVAVRSGAREIDKKWVLI